MTSPSLYVKELQNHFHNYQLHLHNLINHRSVLIAVKICQENKENQIHHQTLLPPLKYVIQKQILASLTKFLGPILHGQRLL